MKYIMFEDFAGSPLPVIFPNRISFEELRRQLPYPTLLSAGKINIESGKVACSGGSKNLKLNSREEDALIISEIMGRK